MLRGRMRAAVLVGTSVTKVVPAMAENASAVEAEPPKGGARCAARAGGARGGCQRAGGERGQDT